METTKDYSKLTISEIARHIYEDMLQTGFRTKEAFVYCRDYLEAMTTLQSINDSYGMDTGKLIVAYFLNNVRQWKGETAKAIKKELNKRLK